MKGGAAYGRNPILTANNPMIDSFDPNKTISWMLLLDANNLYGFAMRQYLPYGNFKWIHNNNLTSDDIMKMGDEDDKGYFLEVDLEYPTNIHNLHDQYPLAPDHIKIDENMLSDFQKNLAKDLGTKSGGNKLGLTLYNKKNYICHYRNLKQYLSLGMKLTKVHRVLEFSQSPWLRSYIDLNTELRQKANSKSEEELPKLMNNSFFGKTCEDTKKYKDIQVFIGSDDKVIKSLQKVQNRPQFHRVKLYNDSFCAIQMIKQKVILNKPRYVGMSVLALSKTIMYDFHYNFVLPNFPGTKLSFTDTDSFCYWIPHPTNIYDKLKELDTDHKWMDFSNYPKDHPNYYDGNKLIPGKFKDETSGTPVIECISLRAKMYSMLVSDGTIKSTAKGVTRAVKRKYLTHDEYKKCLTNLKPKIDEMYRIMQKDHKLFTVKQIKNSLSPFNDKIWMCKENDEWFTHSLGHYNCNS